MKTKRAPTPQARDSVETLTATFVSARRSRITCETNLKQAQAAFDKAEHAFKESKMSEKNAADAVAKAAKEGA